MAVRSKEWVCGSSLSGIVDSNPGRTHGYLSLVSVMCCEAEIPALGWSLAQRSPTERGVTECDREKPPSCYGLLRHEGIK